MLEVPDRKPPFTLNGNLVLDDDFEIICVCPTREIAIFVVRAMNKATLPEVK